MFEGDCIVSYRRGSFRTVIKVWKVDPVTGLAAEEFPVTVSGFGVASEPSEAKRLALAVLSKNLAAIREQKHEEVLLTEQSAEQLFRWAKCLVEDAGLPFPPAKEAKAGIPREEESNGVQEPEA